jgi:hypothetical protein
MLFFGSLSQLAKTTLLIYMYIRYNTAIDVPTELSSFQEHSHTLPIPMSYAWVARLRTKHVSFLHSL